jgi:hypothetical protein
MAAGVSPNGHVYHQEPLRIESQVQNTQKGVGSLTSERGGMGGGIGGGEWGGEGGG